MSLEFIMSNPCMKTVSLVLAVLLSLVCFASAQTTDASPDDAKPLPTMDTLLQQVVNCAVSKEGKNDNLFEMNYQYIRVRKWEYRNSSGELKRTKEKSSVENKPLRLAAKTSGQSTMNKPALTSSIPQN